MAWRRVSNRPQAAFLARTDSSFEADTVMDRFAIRLSRVALGWAWLAALALLALAFPDDATSRDPLAAHAVASPS